MENLRSGFKSYSETGKISKAFVSDTNLLIEKVFRKWSLYEDLEEFSSSCWMKIWKALAIFDEACGSLVTYLNWVVWNEATRIHSKHKKMSLDDTSVLNFEQSLWVSNSQSSDESLALRCKIVDFAQGAYFAGVYVDQKGLYHNYIQGNLTPLVKVFMWSSMLKESMLDG